MRLDIRYLPASTVATRVLMRARGERRMTIERRRRDATKPDR